MAPTCAHVTMRYNEYMYAGRGVEAPPRDYLRGNGVRESAPSSGGACATARVVSGRDHSTMSLRTALHVRTGIGDWMESEVPSRGAA